MDSLTAPYRTKIKSNKWFHSIFFYFIGVGDVNAWLLYIKDCTSYVVRKDQPSLFQFEVEAAGCLRQENKTGGQTREDRIHYHWKLKLHSRRGCQCLLVVQFEIN
jgi:hypothetical protein